MCLVVNIMTKKESQFPVKGIREGNKSISFSSNFQHPISVFHFW